MIHLPRPKIAISDSYRERNTWITPTLEYRVWAKIDLPVYGQVSRVRTVVRIALEA
jgi:hypothetical protein